MSTLNGLFTLGKDCEIRTTQGGDDVATMSLAYNYGRKQDGKQPTQWIRATLWGKRATTLSGYLTKGKQIYAILDDVHVREYESNGKTGVTLEGKVVDLEFTRGNQEQQGQQRQTQTQSAPQQRQPQQSAQRSGFDDMDDTIPF